METLYTATVTAKGGRDGEITSENGTLKGRLAKPAEMGGTGQGFNPEELFAAAWGPCYLGALGTIAKHSNASVEGATCRTSVSFNKEGNGYALSARLEVHIPGMEVAEAQQLADKAHSACPYSRAVKGNIQTEVVAV